MYKQTFLVLFTLISLIAKPALASFNEKPDTIGTIQLGFVLPADKHQMSIPFELNNNLIVIDVLLNNAIPLKFILDTGVRTSVLTEKIFTDLLNLTYSRKITIPGIGGEKLVDAYVTNNVTLKIQDMIGRGHALIVLEEDLLQLKNYLGSNVHGVLGYELFSRFVIEVNYDTKYITFYDPDFYRPKRGFKEIDLNIEDTKPYVNASFSFKDNVVRTGKFMVDTGASHSFLIDKHSNPGYYIPEPSIKSHLGRGLAGDLYGEISRVEHLSVGPFAFEEVITTFPDTSTYDIDVGAVPRNGTIGGGLMSRFKVVFDFVHGKLYLKKGRSYNKSFEYNLSGLIVKATGIDLNTFEVTEVRKGCAAQEAGIMAGDQIVLINGHYTRDLTLDEVLGLINLKENKTIRMIVLRDKIRTKIQFKLVRQV